jgi:hypothetical protein
MRAISDQQAARFAAVTITLGVALIAAGLIAMVAPWYAATLALLATVRLAGSEREDERIRGLYRGASKVRNR